MISVVVPVFNIENYIGECLESILSQTYCNLQIIVVDDGSTDSSGKICDAYAEKDRRIQVIHLENCGPTAARKEGLRWAKGQYVGFVDGDDTIHPRMYEELLKEMEETNADFVHFGFLEERDGQIQPHFRFEDGVFDLSGEKVNFIKKFVLREEFLRYEAMTYSIWSKLFRRNIISQAFEKVPNYLKVGEDLAVICFCIFESKRVVMRRKAFYKYRVIQGSVSRKGSGADMIVERVLIYNFLKTIFKQYECMGEMKKSMRTFLVLHIYGSLQEDAVYGIRIPFFWIASIEKLFGYKLVLYGAGRVGQDYYMQLRKHMQCNLIAWTDRDYKSIKFDYAQLISVEDIKNLDYDMILIAVEREDLAEEIRTELLKKEILPDKIQWNPPAYIYA